MGLWFGLRTWPSMAGRKRIISAIRNPEVFVTCSILSEGEALCDLCGLRIDDEATFLWKKLPGYHPSFNTTCVAMLHHAGYDKAVAS